MVHYIMMIVLFAHTRVKKNNAVLLYKSEKIWEFATKGAQK